MKKVISALLLGAMLTACSPAAPAATSQTKEVTVKGMNDGLKVKVTATADNLKSRPIIPRQDTLLP